MKISRRLIRSHTPVLAALYGAGIIVASLAPAQAQNTQTQNTTDNVTNRAGQVVGQTGQTAGQVGNTVGQVGNTAGNVGNSVANTAGNVATGLQPTLQPVGQGVGNALNNLTQPDSISALLNFLSGVIPNHIEAHVNLDALRVDKVTVDIRGVDLRNLRVDLLVANSRDAGKVRPAMSSAGSLNNTNGTNSGTATSTGAGTGQADNAGNNGVILPGDTPIAGSSTRD